MAREKDEAKMFEATSGKKYYNSQKEYSKEYDKNAVDQIRVRVPKGWNDKMKAYVKESGKYKSVNDMINQMIRAEIPGIDEE